MGVQGPVGGGVGHVLEERPVGLLFHVAADLAGGLVTDGVGEEKGSCRRIDALVVPRERVGMEKAAGA